MTQGVHHPVPIMTEPSIPAPPAVRSYFGWVLLVLIGGLLVVSQTAAYFENSGEKKSESANTVDTTSLRLQLLLSQAARITGTPLPSDGGTPKDGEAKGPGNDPSRSLATVKESFTKNAAKNENSAFLDALTSYELGESPSKAARENLADTKDAGMAAYWKAIQSEKLLPADAKAASTQLKGNEFSDKLARAQLSHKSGAKDPYKSLFTDQEVLVTLVGLTIAVFAFLAGGGCLMLGVGMVASGKWQTRSLTPLPFRPLDADRYALRMGLYLVIYLGVSIAMGFALLRFLPGLPSGLTIMIPSATVGLLVVGMLFIRLEGVADSLKKVMGDLTQWPTHVVVGIAAFLANLPIVFILSALVQVVSAPFKDSLPTPSHPVNGMMASGGMLTLIGIFITASILAPLVEELTFRGLLFPALARIWNPIAAILVQGLFFAAIHPQGPLAWPMLASVGAMAAFVAYKQGSLVPAMVMHFVHNTAILALGMVLM